MLKAEINLKTSWPQQWTTTLFHILRTHTHTQIIGLLEFINQTNPMCCDDLNKKTPSELKQRFMSLSFNKQLFIPTKCHITFRLKLKYKQLHCDTSSPALLGNPLTDNKYILWETIIHIRLAKQSSKRLFKLYTAGPPDVHSCWDSISLSLNVNAFMLIVGDADVGLSVYTHDSKSFQLNKNTQSKTQTAGGPVQTSHLRCWTHVGHWENVTRLLCVFHKKKGSFSYIHAFQQAKLLISVYKRTTVHTRWDVTERSSRNIQLTVFG